MGVRNSGPCDFCHSPWLGVSVVGSRPRPVEEKSSPQRRRERGGRRGIRSSEGRNLSAVCFSVLSVCSVDVVRRARGGADSLRSLAGAPALDGLVRCRVPGYDLWSCPVGSTYARGTASPYPGTRTQRRKAGSWGFGTPDPVTSVFLRGSVSPWLVRGAPGGGPRLMGWFVVGCRGTTFGRAPLDLHTRGARLRRTPAPAMGVFGTHDFRVFSVARCLRGWFAARPVEEKSSPQRRRERGGRQGYRVSEVRTHGILFPITPAHPLRVACLWLRTSMRYHAFSMLAQRSKHATTVNPFISSESSAPAR